MEKFPCICRQTADWIELKVGEQTHRGPPQAWLTIGHAPLNTRRFLELKLICRAVFVHFQTADRINVKFGGLTHYGPSLAWSTIGLTLPNSCRFLASWLVKQFPCIGRQTASRIELNFVGPTHYGPPTAWWRFSEFLTFPGLWLVEQFPRSFRHWIERKFNEQLHYGPLLACLTFGHTPPNSRCFMHFQTNRCLDMPQL